MWVSFNELETRYPRALEALRLPAGVAVDAARMLIWCDQQGLDGLARLLARATCLNAPRSKGPRLAEEGRDHLTLDAEGDSLLAVGPLLLDMAREASAAPGAGPLRRTIALKNCADIDLAPALCALTQGNGLRISIVWRDEPSTFTAWLSPCEKVCVQPSRERDLEPGELRLEITGSEPGEVPPESDNAESTTYPPFRADGLDVDSRQWLALVKIGQHFLVPESESSRAGGAGAGADRD